MTWPLGLEYNGDENEFTTAERNHVVIVKGSIYQHQVLRINYTTYDMRHDQDSINVKTHPDIMLLLHEDPSDEDRNAYWYARVIIFHAYVGHTSPDACSNEIQKKDFVWVQWYILNAAGNHHPGWKTCQLPQLSFVEPADQVAMFSFLDPNVVVCGIHIIPGFAYGLAETGEPPEDNNNMDYFLYYVNM